MTNSGMGAFRCGWPAGAAAVLFMAAAAVADGPYQVTLSVDANINDGAPLAGLTRTGGDGSTANPYVYTFTTGGLNLDAFKAFTDATGGKDSFTLNLGGYDLVGTGTTALSTYCNSKGGWGTVFGNITIANAGAVSIGAIDTRNSNGGTAEYGAGDVAIGSSSTPATGRVRVDSIRTSATGRGSYGGRVTIYATGDVLIQNAGGSNGDMLCRSDQTGRVAIYHRGSFAARRIDARDLQSYFGRTAASVILNGNWNNGANPPSGTLAITDYIDNSLALNGHKGSVTITGYRQVDIKSVTTTVGWNTSYAADVTITGIAGPITITGTLDLRNRATSTITYYGKAVLRTAAGSRGAITLGANEAHVLDCGLFQSITLGSDSGKTYIGGELRMPGATDGAKRSNIPARIKGAAGQRVFYNPKLSQNSWLAGGKYSLGPDGASAGTLEPIPALGAIMIVR